MWNEFFLYPIKFNSINFRQIYSLMYPNPINPIRPNKFLRIFQLMIYKVWSYEFSSITIFKVLRAKFVTALKLESKIHFQRCDLRSGTSSRKPCLLIFCKASFVGWSHIISKTFSMSLLTSKARKSKWGMKSDFNLLIQYCFLSLVIYI